MVFYVLKIIILQSDDAMNSDDECRQNDDDTDRSVLLTK